MNDKIINKNLNKYFSNSLFYFTKPINDILYNYNNNFSILFNDFIYYDEIEENLRRYYNTNESKIRLTNYTDQYSKVNIPYFCNLSKTKVKSIMLKRESKYYKHHNELLNIKTNINKFSKLKNNILLKDLDKITEIIEEVDDKNIEFVKKLKSKDDNDYEFDINNLSLTISVHNIYKTDINEDLKSNSISYSLNYFISDISNINLKYNTKTSKKLDIFESIKKPAENPKKNKKKQKKIKLNKINIIKLKTKIDNKILKKSSKLKIFNKIKTQNSNKILTKKIKFKWLKTYNKKSRINLDRYTLKNNNKGLTGSLTTLVRPISKLMNTPTMKYLKKNKQIKRLNFDNYIFNSNKNIISSSPAFCNKYDLLKKKYSGLFTSEAINKIKTNKILNSKSIYKSIKSQKLK